MKKVFGIFLVFAACQSVPSSSDVNSYLFNVEENQISSEEFVYAFEKNNFNKDSATTEIEIREYLELYINFKLKVHEAKALGMDTSESYRTELEGYRKQLAIPYLTETTVTQELLKEAYGRLKEEVRASHILLISKPGSSPEDTLRTYTIITELRQRAIGGEEFDRLAEEFSEDPSAKRNKGDLGYFSAFQMVYPFEDAAFNTEVGSISPIIRTQFGYHILKVTDRRPSLGKVKVSHIMIRATDNIPAKDSIFAKNKIDEIYKLLNEGSDWKELCREFSQDVNTRNTGGQLPWLSPGNVPPSFEKAAFGLQETGQISAPVKTSFGWHIIKFDGKKDIESFESMKDELSIRVQRDSRSEKSSKAFIDKIKIENNFIENNENYQLATNSIDSSLLKANWKTPEQIPIAPLFSIGNSEFMISEFYHHLEKNQRSSGPISLPVLVKSYYNDFVELSLKTYEEDHLSEKYFEYRMLYQEYSEGIMLFQLMDQKIWTGAVKDTSGLDLYYKNNLEKYMAAEKVSATVYNAATDSIRQEIIKMIEEQDSMVLSKKELKSYFNEKSALNLQTEEKLFDKFDPIIAQLPEKTPGTYNFELNNRFYLMIIDKIVPPETQPLDAIRGQVITDYQDYLENEWIINLREKYNVDINEKELDRLINELETK